MSQIVIVPRKRNIESSILFLLKNKIGENITLLKSHFENETPLYKCNLFYNDHDEVVDKLLGITSILESHSIKYGIYELDEDEPYNIETARPNEIDLDTMKNIIDSFNEEREKEW